MRVIKVYQPPGRENVIDRFLSDQDPRLARKLRRQFFILAHTPDDELKEPHYKHFSLERYSQFYEVREKRNVVVRVIFTIQGGDILLLQPFIKKETRDTMRALEQSIRMFTSIREKPELAVEYKFKKEDLQ